MSRKLVPRQTLQLPTSPNMLREDSEKNTIFDKAFLRNIFALEIVLLEKTTGLPLYMLAKISKVTTMHTADLSLSITVRTV